MDRNVLVASATGQRDSMRIGCASSRWIKNWRIREKPEHGLDFEAREHTSRTPVIFSSVSVNTIHSPTSQLRTIQTILLQVSAKF
jgi:hypothetical protein